MGISRGSWHKRLKTGGRQPKPHVKRKFELGRPAAMTRIGATRVHRVRTRGGNLKMRALRLETGNFSWPTLGEFFFCLFFFFSASYIRFVDQKKKSHKKSSFFLRIRSSSIFLKNNNNKSKNQIFS